jgi:DNA-binding response OmpR family regulator
MDKINILILSDSIYLQEIMQQFVIRNPEYNLLKSDGSDDVHMVIANTNDNIDCYQHAKKIVIGRDIKEPIYLAMLFNIIKSCEQLIAIGNYMFSRKKRQVILDNQEISLTEKETELLQYLYEAGGNPVSNEDLLKGIWKYSSEIDSSTLQTHIYRLRQKISSVGDDIIENDGSGYRILLQ